MNSAMSWSVKGIEPEVREAAKLAARKSGQTMGQWLKAMILDSSERANDEAVSERFVPHNGYSSAGPDPVQNRIDQLEKQLSTLTNEQSETAVGLRFGASAQTAHGDVTLQQILERLDRNEEATIRTMAVVQERVSEMARELSDSRISSAGSSGNGIPSEPEAFERALENVVDHIESTDKETRDTLADLHRKLEALSEEIASGPNSAETANRKILSDVEHRLTALAHQVDQIGQADQQQLKLELETRLSDLAEQVEQIGEAVPDGLKETLDYRLTELTHRIDTAEQVARQVQSDLTTKVDKRLEHLSERLEAVGRESEEIATRAATAAVQSAVDEFREIETRVQQLAAQIQAPPSSEPGAADTPPELMKQVADLSRDVQQIKLDAATEQDVQALKSMFDTLSGTMDRRFAEVSSEAALAQLEQRLAELGQRVDQVGRAGDGSADPKVGELEQRLQDLDARLTAAQDDDTATALGNQIDDVSKRVSVAEQQFSGIQAIESSIAQLFEGIEQTRNFATEVAEKSAAGMVDRLSGTQAPANGSSTLEALEAGLHAVRASAATADKRNHDTLEAVHDTLEKVISRLTALETAPGDPLQGLVPAPADYAEDDVAAESGPDDLADLRLPPIPPMTSPQGFNTAAEGAETLSGLPPIDDEALGELDEEYEEYDDGDTELPALDSGADQADGPSLAAMAATGQPTKRSDFIAAARNAARVIAEDPELNTDGAAAKGKRGSRRSRKAKQAGDARNARRRPLVLAAIVLLMIGAASAYTLIGGKRTPAKPEQAAAPTSLQLMSPAGETVEPPEAETPADRSVAAPNDQQSLKSDPLAQDTTQVTKRSDQEPMDALLPVPTQGKQPLDQAPAAATPRSPEMAGDPSGLTTGSIKTTHRIEPDKVIAPTDPLLLAVTGMAPPETRMPAKKPAAADSTPESAPEITGSTTVARTPSETIKQQPSSPATPNVKNLPPREVGPMGLRVAAAAGDPVAQFVVATKYSEGGALKQDFRTAAQWYQKAAGRGLAPAQYRLATFYEKGKGVPQDLAAARIWYERAAEKGNRKAMHNLAVIYADGSRGTPNFNKAGIWFRQAADLGLKDSQYNLAILHERGLGVPKDLGQAYKWFALAARQGDSDAESRMNKIETRLTQQDLIQAKLEIQSWTAKTADRQANVVTPPADGWEGPGAATNSTSLSNAELIAEAQNLLNRLGYHAGRADGLMGSRTREAIRGFQKDNNLPVSGTVTPNLLTTLRQKSG